LLALWRSIPRLRIFSWLGAEKVVPESHRSRPFGLAGAPPAGKWGAGALAQSIVAGDLIPFQRRPREGAIFNPALTRASNEVRK